jgi:hypothetical protein
MACIHKISRCLALGLMLILLSVMTLPEAASAKSGSGSSGSGKSDDRGSGRGKSDDRRFDRGKSDGRGSGHREFRDSRFRHDRFYPARGQFIRTLPHDHRVVIHGRSRFFFSNGVWYSPHRSRFVIIAPPIGLFVPFLPPYYTTVWVGGTPYYYANEVYYANRGDGYAVVEPPAQEPSQVPPSAEQMFIYPRLGQTEKQQEDDRYDCHGWAVSQTGFDPTHLSGEGSQGRNIGNYADYQRAMAACLDGRGYTVK